MSVPILYVTATNTSVGKTFLSALLLRRARDLGLPLAALKPFCSGGREDAIQLHAMQTAGLTLEEVNPFHFDEPLAPLAAARKANRAVRLGDVLAVIDAAATRGHPIVLEGAGGLLSPLGEKFFLREIIAARPGHVCVVAPNILGSINSVLLTLAGLPPSDFGAQVVLMRSEHPDSSSSSNAAIIRELSAVEVLEIPFLEERAGFESIAPVLDQILKRLRA